VIVDPPLFGAEFGVVVNEAINRPKAPVPAPVAPLIVGAAGIAVTVADADAPVVGLFPAAVVAYAVNVYAVPAVRPVTVTGLVPVAEIDPGFETTVYVAGTPPRALAVIATVAAALLLGRLVPTSDGAPTVGRSGMSAIFVAPAEASIYFLPVKFESDAFLVAIRRSHFRRLKTT
jgi:hypothetical protein